jgi:drug/metabolite transporter (DMT)-like permease
MAIVNGVASGTELSSSKKLTGSYAPLYVTFLSWFAIFICNGTVSFLLRETQHIPSFNIAWAYLLTFAVASVLSSWLVFAGLQYVESSIGALVGLLEIIFSITFGILIFHEGLASGVLIGGSFIITAAALPHLYEFRKMQRWVVFSVDKKM